MSHLSEVRQFQDERPDYDDDQDEDMGEESEPQIGLDGGPVDGSGLDGSGDEPLDDDLELDEDGIPRLPFNPIAMGLKEINGLSHFRVSSYKPGNGVEELVNDDIDRYWQYVSDNPPSPISA